jgi:hypothetical protein
MGLSTVADELMMSTAGSPVGGSAIARERVIAATRKHARTCRSVEHRAVAEFADGQAIAGQFATISICQADEKTWHHARSRDREHLCRHEGPHSMVRHYGWRCRP